MGAPGGVVGDIDHTMSTAALAAAAAAAAAAQAAGLHAVSSAGGNLPTVMSPNINSSRDNMLLAAESGLHHGGNATSASHHNATSLMVHPGVHGGLHHHPHHSHHPHHPHHHPHHQQHHHAGSLSQSQFSNQKTRMRTSFDPEMELPRLQKWFQENPHPSRQQIQAYVVQLNALESRRGRKPLDVNNVVYWFKNARAAQKRAEMRGNLGVMHAAMNGYLSQHGGQMGQTSGGSSTGSLSSQQHMIGASMGNLSLSNDFLKSPLSLKSEDIDTISQHSDEMDEDCSPSDSPQFPLSLTMHERNQNGPAEVNISGGEGGSAAEDASGNDELLEDSNRSDIQNESEQNAASEVQSTGNSDNINKDRQTTTGDEKNENTLEGDRQDNEHIESIESSTDNVNKQKDQFRDESDERSSNRGYCDKPADNLNIGGQSGSKAMTSSSSEANNSQAQIDNNSNNNNKRGENNNERGESGNNNGGAGDNSNNSSPTGSNSLNHLKAENAQQFSQPNSPQNISPLKDEDDDLDMEEDDDDNEGGRLEDFRSPSPPDLTSTMLGAQRKDLPFPMVPNNMFSQSFMYMSHYMPGFGQAAVAAAAHPHAAAAAHHAAAAAAAAGMQPGALMGASGLNLSNISSEERRKRNRTFIDPVTEVPKLEQWFAMNTHPSHNLILKYTEDLNTMPYR